MGPGKGEEKNLVWCGEIERKLAKLSMTTFIYRSSSQLFYSPCLNYFIPPCLTFSVTLVDLSMTLVDLAQPLSTLVDLVFWPWLTLVDLV